jgi:DNA invertase Pin-like site-specific DNA recombinase
VAFTTAKTYRKTLEVLRRFCYDWGMIFGYARVSTDDQNLDAQLDALQAAGVERIFKEKITGKARTRPELERLLEQMRPNDVIIVTKYDRLARSLKDLIDIVDLIRERGAGFKSLGEDIDTTTPAGRLVFHVFGSIAEFERERIVERTKEGLAAARSRGRVGGRPPALSHDQREEVRRMRDHEHRPIGEVARLFEVSKDTVRRA